MTFSLLPDVGDLSPKNLADGACHLQEGLGLGLPAVPWAFPVCSLWPSDSCPAPPPPPNGPGSIVSTPPPWEPEEEAGLGPRPGPAGQVMAGSQARIPFPAATGLRPGHSRGSVDSTHHLTSPASGCEVLGDGTGCSDARAAQHQEGAELASAPRPCAWAALLPAPRRDMRDDSLRPGRPPVLRERRQLCQKKRGQSRLSGELRTPSFSL